MPGFQGSSAVVAYGLEKAEGMGGSQRTFMRFVDESLEMKRPTESNPNMDPSNLETEPQNLAANGGGKVKSAPDVNTLLRQRAQQRGHAVHTNLAAGVDQWFLRNRFVGDDPELTALQSLFWEVYRDDGIGHLFLGAKCTNMALSVVEYKFASLEHDYLFSRESEMADPAPQVGNNVAFTGYVLARGQRNDPESILPWKVKVLTAGALDGTAKVGFVKGAGAYGATSYAVVSGQPIGVIAQDLTVAGDRANHEKVQVLFIEGAPGDVLTLGDEWVINQPRPEPSPIFSTSQVLTAVGAEAAITINGTTKTYPIHTFGMTYGTPKELDGGIGQKYAFGVIPAKTSKEVATWTFAKNYTDPVFYRALVANYPVEINVPIYGNMIDATHQEMWQLAAQKAKVNAGGAVVSTAGVLPETATIKSFTDGNNVPSLEETIVGSIAAL